MPSRYRLSRTDFTKMHGFKRLHGSFFSLSFGTIPERSSPGVACVVSSKIAAKAVDRNRIKRRCRAILAESVEQLRSPLVIVVIAKKGAAKAPFLETSKDLRDLIARIGAVRA
jgi:ribonuclease P protein component